jgi:ABC-type transport system involved in cytochrome c biogenesis permease component
MEVLIVSIIQAMLAPGIMISACGLLLLGMNNKYSLVVTRIRALSDEKRKLIYGPKQGNLNKDEEKRLDNINMEIDLFANRVVLVKKAVTSYYIAVALYIFASLLIGFNFISDQEITNILALIFFLGGMVSVVVGVYYAAQEIKKGLEIVKIEITNV